MRLVPTVMTALTAALLAGSAQAAVYEVPLGEGVLEVRLDDDDRRVLSDEDVTAWIAAEGAAVAKYFGGFPMKRAVVEVSTPASVAHGAAS